MLSAPLRYVLNTSLVGRATAQDWANLAAAGEAMEAASAASEGMLAHPRERCDCG